jgi:hypothetical protein
MKSCRRAAAGCRRPRNDRSDRQMRYIILWLLGVPISVLVLIWLITGWGG